jgi:hypothetical protein
MMAYMVYHTLWHLHCISFVAFNGIWSYVTASSRDRTGTASFMDAALYLVRYEGRRHGICSILLLSMAFALHSMAYGVMTLLLAATVPVQHHLSMRLHTLLGMKARDMAFELHMHYDFGSWHIYLGFRLWEKH